MDSKAKKRQYTYTQDDIVIHRVFILPASKLWQALTVAEYFKQWWGPNGFTCPFCTMEARKGGKYLSCMRDPDGKEYWSTGVVKEFIPEKKLVVTDSFADSKGNIIAASEYGMPGDWPKELLIAFELEEAAASTKLKLTQVGVPEEMHDECMKGWNESLDKLEENIT